MSERSKPEHDDRVHLFFMICGFGVIATGCGARMQVTNKTSELSNEVNYWGKTGIRIERPWTSITLDPTKVTCKRKGCRSTITAGASALARGED